MAVILDYSTHSTYSTTTTRRRMSPCAALVCLQLLLLVLLRVQRPAEGLRISGFRVPSYVPITLPTTSSPSQSPSQPPRHPLELSKPILFDCDYDYSPGEDLRLAVRWFRNKEPEPFYQWLPELNERHLADWIRPLVNQSFVSDPVDPMKRYRSLLIKRLSMGLSGSYTCLVSSLAGQDSRQAQLVVYQPPAAFTFVQRIYPPPALGALQAPKTGGPPSAARAPSPTQFRGLAPAAVVRPPNNLANSSSAHQNQTAPRLVYTHDGRPIRRSRRQISAWQLERRLGPNPTLTSQQQQQQRESGHIIQLHHFECQATQVSPRPVLVLTVKRNAEAIAQYLHEASTTTLRPHQVEAGDPSPEPTLVTLYDITVSATVALNVSLPSQASGGQPPGANSSEAELVGATTVLQFRRGQRMSFECQLEITGTEFEQRKRIQVNDQEVYQFAELEERKRQQQDKRQQLQEPSHQLLGREQIQQQQQLPALGSNSAARATIGAASLFHLGLQLVALLSLPLDHRI